MLHGDSGVDFTDYKFAASRAAWCCRGVASRGHSGSAWRFWRRDGAGNADRKGRAAGIGRRDVDRATVGQSSLPSDKQPQAKAGSRAPRLLSLDRELYQRAKNRFKRLGGISGPRFVTESTTSLSSPATSSLTLAGPSPCDLAVCSALLWKSSMSSAMALMIRCAWSRSASLGSNAAAGSNVLAKASHSTRILQHAALEIGKASCRTLFASWALPIMDVWITGLQRWGGAACARVSALAESSSCAGEALCPLP